MADQAEIGGVARAGKPRKQKEGVFISYARRDGKHFAGKLRDRLEREGIPCWQDIVGMEGGRDWWMQIQDAINSVEFLVLVMTPAAMQSKTVRKEWRYARQQGVCVYPVIATPPAEFNTLVSALPRWMRDVHFYDLGQDTDHFEHGSNWVRFLNDLRTRCEVPRVPFMADDLGVYIQRSKEYDALIDLLLDTDRDEPKAITSTLALKGAGGYGKTTLARAICHDERIQEAFDDGILWVTLGESATYDTVREQLESLIFALSGEQANAPTLEAAKTRLRELLADRDILLVIDDVWNADLVRPFLEGGERVARLITTRMGDTLPKGARPISVNQMTGDEAFALIAFGLPADQTDEQRDELAQMAARLGEYPLLLKLTNGILHDRMHDGEPLEKALDYLKRAFDKRGITKAIQVENSTDRNRAVDASLSLSLERLNNQRREWFTRLAIFPEDTPIPFATLEKAWRCDDLDVEETCAALNRLSLLLSYNLQTHTIALHDVIRAYLREQLIGGTDKLNAANAAFLDRYGIAHWRDMPPDEPYLWNHLAYHLIEVGRGEDLITTVLDLRYLAAKSHLRGTAKTEADIEAAGKHVRAIQHFQSDALNLLERNYRNMAHILARCKSVNDVLVTLHTRLSHLDALKFACEAVEQELKPRISPYQSLPDLPHPALIRTLAGHMNNVRSAAFSPDGAQVVSASYDNMLKLWDAASGIERLTLRGHKNRVISAAFSPDGQWIVSASSDKTVKLWDAASGVERLTLTGHTDGVYNAAFSPDGRQVVSASSDKTVKLWDATSGVERLTLTGHTKGAHYAAFSPDGRQVVSASDDGTLKLWDATSGVERLTLAGHESRVNSAAFSPEGQWIVSASSDKTIKLWDAASGVERLTLHGHTDQVNSAAFSADGRWIVSASGNLLLFEDNTVRLWDAASGVERFTLHGHTGAVYSAAFSPDGWQVVSASLDNTVKLWDAASGVERLTLHGHTDKVNSVAFSPDGHRIVSGSSDKTVKLWDAASEVERLTLRGYMRGYKTKRLSAAFSPDGQQVISAWSDNTVKLWDAATGVERLTLHGHTDQVNSAAFSPDGHWIVSTARDQTVKLWDPATGALLATLAGHKDQVNSGSFSPDGRQVVSASSDKTVKLWDAATGALLVTLAEHTDGVLSAAFAPDSQHLVSASLDKTVKLWDAATGALLATLAEHTDSVRSAAFAPNSQHLVSASADKTLKIWDAQTGVCHATFYADVPLDCCAWSPDGKYIVAGGGGGYIYWLRWVE